MSDRADITILGGGLAGGLIAFALSQRRPDMGVTLVEREPTLGGNHIWSFFDTDIAEEDRWIVAPFVSHRWDGYDVRFPGHRRVLSTGYNSIESGQFDRVLRSRLPAVRLNEDGEPEGAAIDARGAGDLGTLQLGWQKFVGQVLRVEGGHGLTRPVVMDATVEQIDGYRFVYLLPFDAERVFVEDTYYSDSAALDVAAIGARIEAYAAAQGWRVTATQREETGVLPVVIGGDFDAYWRSTGAGLAKAGMRAGLFHPTTGYSLPDAVRLASAIAKAPDLSAEGLARLTRAHAERTWRARGFYRLLDAMLFRAAEPAQRYRVLERFYRLPEPLIGRFYGGRSTTADMMRLLIGKPPVPIGRAIAAVMKR
ncbi:lycopene beta-cyclase CrtY [Sphingomonas sp. MAH-20]|uniref:Lycopene beta-cyclase CrtY n=1 Tax=Sphingomonas horti TaxID=2682842 RepID=A0A6I4J3L2_9SPHN|nr:lycopene beta-cyclase CrtY [Sphingomonas sp. CGMCC 1.13658]MBA2918811.1 lycopene beta-cyclase CrtY [Sphingomonas sp. CGMCC 1.13658]MVO78844.1 lycopene beta-cyclase CrtY [Sphingomonas horti]